MFVKLHRILIQIQTLIAYCFDSPDLEKPKVM